MNKRPCASKYVKICHAFKDEESQASIKNGEKGKEREERRERENEEKQ